MSWCKKCLHFLSPSMKHEIFYVIDIFSHSTFSSLLFLVVIGVWNQPIEKEKKKLSLFSMRERRKFRWEKRMWSLEHLWYVGKFLLFCAPPTISLFPCWNVETIFCVWLIFFVCFYYKKNLKFISWGWDTLESISIII